MRKRYLVGGLVVAVVAGALAVMPVVAGRLTESRFRASIEDSPLPLPPHVDLALLEYERGYLGATATSKLTYEPPGGSTFSVVLRHKIRHAPVAGMALARVHTVVRVPPGKPRRLVRRLFGDRPPLTLDYELGVFGTERVRIHSPATEGRVPLAGGWIEWRGLEGVMTFANGEMLYEIHAPGLTLQPPPGGKVAILAIHGMRLEGEQRATRFEGIWTGSWSFSVDRAAIRGVSERKIVLADFKSQQSVSLTEGLLGFATRFSLARIEMPARVVTDLGMHWAGKRIPPELIQALQKVGYSSNGRGDGRPFSVLQQIAWGRLAASRPVIALKRAEAHVDSGTIVLSGRIGLRPPGERQDSLSLSDLRGLAYAGATLSVPRDLVVRGLSRFLRQLGGLERVQARRAARRRLQGMRRRGLIRIRSGAIRVSVAYRGGIVKVNGERLLGVGR